MCKADRLLAAAPERSNRGFRREIALGQRARPENPLLHKNHDGTLGLSTLKVMVYSKTLEIRNLFRNHREESILDSDRRLL